MKWAIYGIGCIAIFILVANLLGIALTISKFHQLKGSTLRAAVVLVMATLFAIWATQRLAVVPNEIWTQAAQHVGRFTYTHKSWLIGASVASFIGFLTLGAPGGILFTALDSIVNLVLAHPLGWRSPRGDSVWPTAIVYSLLAPWAAFAVFLGLKRVWVSSGPFILWWGTFAVTFVIFLAIHILYRRSN